MVVDFRFWLLQDMFNLLITNKRTMICIYDETPEDFYKSLKRIKTDGAIIYQQKQGSIEYMGMRI